MIRRALKAAWIGSIRQPIRTGLGVLGVMAIGALLFDMLLLSRGLVLSFGELLDRTGFDVRVLATDARPLAGPSIEHADEIAAAIAALPEVAAVLQVRVGTAEIETDGGRGAAPSRVELLGTAPPGRSMWTLLDGRDLPARAGAADAPELVINRQLSRTLGLTAGSTLRLHGVCADASALPAVAFTVSGIAEFPFDDASTLTAAGRLDALRRLCSVPDDEADMLMVRSKPTIGSAAAAAAIRRTNRDVHVVTNEDLLERFSRVEFSYFRQISSVLATVTLFFGFLLIAVLLTVSVNGRLGEIAMLRAIGLSRLRVLLGVLWESMFLVGAGGILAVPTGFGLSLWLDRILRQLPGIPIGVHFFVFEPRVLVTYSWLLGFAAVGAAVYPMRIVARLPISATLRQEAVS